MESEAIRDLARRLTVGKKSAEQKAEQIFYYVRDSIRFDFSADYMRLPEKVLSEGQGNSPQKAGLFASLVHAADILPRYKFYTIPKKSLKPLIHPLAYPLFPDSIFHVCPEINLNGEWIPMEVAFDMPLIKQITRRFSLYEKIMKYYSPDLEFSVSGVTGLSIHLISADEKPSFSDNLTPLRYAMVNIPAMKRRLLSSACALSSRWIKNRFRKI